MRSIWKFELINTDYQEVIMPANAKILTVQTQNGIPCIWAEVKIDNPKVNRAFRIYGTGNPMTKDDELKYVGTYQLFEGEYVFHLYEVLY